MTSVMRQAVLKRKRISPFLTDIPSRCRRCRRGTVVKDTFESAACINCGCTYDYCGYIELELLPGDSGPNHKRELGWYCEGILHLRTMP